MPRNEPKKPADKLLESAGQILKSSKTTFEVKPWREIMPAANAKAKAAEMKAAAKKIEAKGVTRPRHQVLTSTQPKLVSLAPTLGAATMLKPGESAPGVRGVFPNTGLTTPAGGDTLGVLDSSTHTEQTMTKETKEPTKTTKAKDTKTEAGLHPQTPDAQKAKEDAVKAAMEAKAKKKADAEEAKKKADAEKAAKKAEREKAWADAKAKKQAEMQAKAEAAKAAGSERTYFGSMLQLSDRVKSGAYVKGANGQLRSNDDVAIALESCSPANVVALLTQVLKAKEIAHKDYSALNVGQQSMNLRNVLRGAIKAGKISIDEVKAVRDAGNFADAEKIAAEKKAKQDAAAEKRKVEAEAKAKAKEEAAAKAKADAEAKKAAPAAEPAPATA